MGVLHYHLLELSFKLLDLALELLLGSEAGLDGGEAGEDLFEVQFDLLALGVQGADGVLLEELQLFFEGLVVVEEFTHLAQMLLFPSLQRLSLIQIQLFNLNILFLQLIYLPVLLRQFICSLVQYRFGLILIPLHLILQFIDLLPLPYVLYLRV